MVHEGAEIEFRTPDGSDGLLLGALRAEDARGEPLAARLALEGSTLSIWIEAAEAEVPISVEAGITGLSPTDDWGLTFGEAGAEFGSSVATAGDVDGDGYSEVIIGAPYYDGGLTEQGGAFVYHGSSGGLYDICRLDQGKQPGRGALWLVGGHSRRCEWRRFRRRHCRRTGLDQR